MQIETVAKEGFLPVRVHPTDAGADLRADIPEPVTLQPRESTFFNTGIEVAIPEGYFGALAIRSSLSLVMSLFALSGNISAWIGTPSWSSMSCQMSSRNVPIG